MSDTHSLGDGTVEEVLQKAAEALKEYPAWPEAAFLVCWYSVNKEGKPCLRYLQSAKTSLMVKSLLSDMAFETHIATRGIFGNRGVDEI